jgi:hypothetical protein
MAPDTFETARLLLRPVTIMDVDAIFGSYDRAVQGSPKGGYAIGRKTAALGLRLGAGLMLAAMFVAENFVSRDGARQLSARPSIRSYRKQMRGVGRGGSGPKMSAGSGV